MIKFDKILLDFDDTLWSRDFESNKDLLNQSIKNIKFLNDHFKDSACIISGNSYESIRKKLMLSYDDLSHFDIDLWADANSTLYKYDEKKDFIKAISIDKYADKIKGYLKDNYNIEATVPGYIDISHVKIKPLQELERSLLVDLLNNFILKKIKATACVAVKAGKTTVDILHKDNDKTAIFKYLNLQDKRTLYIGDEVDSGNDRNIANMCTDKIKVSSIYETFTILNMLSEDNK